MISPRLNGLLERNTNTDIKRKRKDNDWDIIAPNRVMGPKYATAMGNCLWYMNAWVVDLQNNKICDEGACDLIKYMNPSIEELNLC